MTARNQIQLPSSSPSRRSRTYSYAKLLYRVDPHATSGFGFEGKLHKPGHQVAENELWPTLAIAALAACRRPQVPIIHDLPAISARIGSLLDSELAALEPAAQDQVLNVLHNHFAIRSSR